MSQHLLLMSYAKPQAGPTPANYFWYNRTVPNAVFSSSQTSYGAFIPLNNENSVVWYGIGDTASFTQKISNATKATVWSSNGYSGIMSVANNDEIILHTTTGMTRINAADGSFIWRANTKDSWVSLQATDDGYVRLTRANGTVTNTCISKWTTDGTTLVWYYNFPGATINMTTYQSLGKNYLQNRFYVSGQWSPSTSTLHCFDDTGAKKWGYNFTTTVYGIPKLNQVTDNANNIYLLLNNFPNDFAKITDNGTTATSQWRKAVPSGNSITVLANDIGGNVFIGCYNGGNAYLTKTDSSGAVLWTNRFQSIRTSQERNLMVPIDLNADPNGVYISIETRGQYYDTVKNNWYDSGVNEYHILRVPTSGANTSATALANLKYESITAMTLTAQTTIGLTANTGPANNFVNIASNTQSNTITYASNTRYYILGTSLP